MDYISVQNTESCKYLGIFIDCDLKWHTHINYIHNKLLKFTSIFYKIRIKLPESILRMICFTFVHSQLLYGIEVYANTTSNHLAKSMTLNDKLLRIIQKKSSRSHAAEQCIKLIIHSQYRYYFDENKLHCNSSP